MIEHGNSVRLLPRPMPSLIWIRMTDVDYQGEERSYDLPEN